MSAIRARAADRMNLEMHEYLASVLPAGIGAREEVWEAMVAADGAMMKAVADAPPEAAADTHVWRHRKWSCADFAGPRQPDPRVGQRCRVLATRSNGNMLAAFEDGALVVGVRCSAPEVPPARG